MARLIIFFVLALAGTATPLAQADTAKHRFDIPAQPLGAALQTLADQAGVQMFYAEDSAAGKSTPALRGEYTTREAVDRLLAGTGLRATLTEDGTVTVAEAEPEAEPKPKAEAVLLPEMTVTAKPSDDTSYSVRNATTATKTDTPIFDTPVSVQVVPYQVLQDQKSYRLRDALENVSGVRPRSSLGGYRERYFIRGFNAGENFYRNGLRIGSSGFTSTFETATTERIEVLKGPAAALYGRGEPGGAISFQTKQPKDYPYYFLEQDFGSYDFYRTIWDAGRPLTEDGSLAFRVSGAYTNTETFRDFGSLDGFVLYPSLLWRPTAKTDVNLGVEAIYQDFHADYGVPVVGRRPAPIPISRSLQDPNDPEDNQYIVNLDFSLNHRFNESWRLTNRFLASYRHEDNIDAFPLGLRADDRTLDRSVFFQDFDLETYTTNLDLAGDFDTGALKHEVLVGFDYFRDTQDYFFNPSVFTADPDLVIDIFNPRYGIDPTKFDPGRSTAVLSGSITKEEWYGLYFQDHVTLWDRLHLLAGGRQDWVDQTNEGFIDNTFVEQELAEFSPRVGLLYQIWGWLGIYGNWAQSFGSNNGLTATGESLPPENGEQFEAGLKGEWLDGRLSSTLAYYHIEKGNLATPDFTTPDPTDRALIGEARSQGIEFDMAGQITEGLDLIATCAFTDARITKDGSGNQGNRLPGVPEHSGRLWLKYDFPPASVLDGWSLGGGVYVVGDRQGDNANSYKLPGFARVDAFLSYRFKLGTSALIAQLNVRNLLDKEYYDSSDQFSNAGPRESVFSGEPLTFIGSLRPEY